MNFHNTLLQNRGRKILRLRAAERFWIKLPARFKNKFSKNFRVVANRLT